MSNITAVIPAAGLGTRAIPNSFASPKELAAVYNKPAIQWVIEEAVAANIEKIVVVISKEKSAIQRYFAGSLPLEEELQRAGKSDAADSLRHIRELGSRLIFVEQTQPLGLGHAVLVAEPVCQDAFVVMTPDDLWLPKSQVMHRLRERFSSFPSEKGVIATRHVPIEEIHSYGCPKPKGNYSDNADFFEVERIVEKPAAIEAPSDLAVSGRWLLPHETFDYLRSSQPGAQGEIQLTGALDELAMVGKLGTEIFADGLYYDIGNAAGLACATIAFGAQDEANRGRFRDVLDLQ